MVPTGNPGPVQTSNINWDPPSGPWINPKITYYNSWNYNTNPREFVWNSINNGQYLSRPPLNNEYVYIRIIFPPAFQNHCCVDTINFCIRWTFSDTTCRTCDTITCHTIIQQWQGSSGGFIPGLYIEEEPINLQWQQPEQMEMIKPIEEKIKK
jgi:hypothetical protein